MNWSGFCEPVESSWRVVAVRVEVDAEGAEQTIATLAPTTSELSGRIDIQCEPTTTCGETVMVGVG